MTAQKYLDFLNKTYFKLHKKYEDLFWLSYMGKHSVDKRKDIALAKRDAFRANPKYAEEIKDLLKKSNSKEKKRFHTWLKFFQQYQ